MSVALEKVSKNSQVEGLKETISDDIVDFVLVDKLQEFGVNAGDLKKLKAAGIHTISGVLMQTKKSLLQIKGISDAKVEKILQACAKLANGLFMTGSDCMIKRKNLIKITTGSTAFDKLLGGGIESMGITEAFGEFRTGKTQIAHTLCVTSQLPHDIGGGNGKVIYIDTEGTFRPERIVSIAKRYNISPEEALDHIIYARAYTHEHQDALIAAAASKMVEERYSLIVVDSITALFRVDFSGRGELAARQQALAQTLSRLIKLAEEFNVAVFITNQVVSDPGGGAVFISDPKKPVGGHILAHASTTRLSLRKGKGEQRVVKIYDSPCLPENEAPYQIAEDGIKDV